MTHERLTQFDYLLNAMERAAQHPQPASQGYGDKRKALFAHVRGLEAKAAVAERMAQALKAIVDPDVNVLARLTPANVEAARKACAEWEALK